MLQAAAPTSSRSDDHANSFSFSSRYRCEVVPALPGVPAVPVQQLCHHHSPPGHRLDLDVCPAGTSSTPGNTGTTTRRWLAGIEEAIGIDLVCFAHAPSIASVGQGQSMGIMSWGSIAEQLRSIGVVLPVDAAADHNCGSVPHLRESPSLEANIPPVSPSIDQIGGLRAAENAEAEEVCRVIKFATASGVKFFQRVSDGELIEDGMHGLQHAQLNTMKSMRREILSGLLA